MEMSAEALKATLTELKSKRLSGELNPMDFYRELLKLSARLFEELIEEAANGMAEVEVKRQIPLIIALLTSQIDLLEKRGG